eukprot:CAMPEP_0197601846 /NCGR_PEP_ID=MMETSP1326-20131121/36070_1 /TAXON_ID=1155430 /ORGANISM="Genus nov. species nov., Strain RCC2288" /LENGTH=117 /DNA_ID=CAMNT_0043169115 /DNA_START=34 /DNA_END=387 /DNA_ORIENTATION=+
MTVARCPHTLALVWTLTSLSFLAKATKSRLDNMYLHVPVFLGAGWSVVTVWGDVTAVLSPWALQLCVVGGSLYTIGLLPWSSNSFECHNAIWHVFVLSASACFFAVAYFEVAGGDWQ